MTMWQKSPKKIKDGIFQVETCRIQEVYKTKPMANLTCFSVSSRTACVTLKIHMLQQHQSTRVKPAVVNVSSNRFMPPPVK